MKDRLIILALISIPAAAVLMGAISMYLAFRGPSQEIPIDRTPASKTSWQEKGGADDH